MGRKKSREESMKLLFGKEVTKGSVDEVIDIFLEEYEEDIKEINLKYVRIILNGIQDKKDEIDSLIKENLKGWTIDRISKVNLAIIRVGIYEMKYLDDVPKKVAINEAIEMCKVYSDEKSVSFVNGILDKILHSL